MPAAKFVPVFPGPILMGRDVHARSRFDRFSHHAHGRGGWIAATVWLAPTDGVPMGGNGANDTVRRLLVQESAVAVAQARS